MGEQGGKEALDAGLNGRAVGVACHGFIYERTVIAVTVPKYPNLRIRLAILLELQIVLTNAFCGNRFAFGIISQIILQPSAAPIH